MSDLMQQHGKKIELSDTQLSPRDLRGDDFEIGSVSRSEKEYREALRDSEIVRKNQSRSARSEHPISPRSDGK